MAKDTAISERVTRVEEIIERLDTAEDDPAKGADLYEEGQQLLTEIRTILDDGRGEVVELE